MANFIRKVVRDEGGDDDDEDEQLWSITGLEGVFFDLDGLFEILSDGPHPLPRGQLVRVDVGIHEEWVLVGDESVRVNGLPVESRMRRLDHRDEITIGGANRGYLSMEQPARVATLPGADRPIHCPRCRLVIEPGSTAVRCPRCLVWHHQSEEYPCWTLEGAESCAACRAQPNTLDERPEWLPKD